MNSVTLPEACSERWPASHGQNRILYFCATFPDSAAYSIVRVFDLDCHLDWDVVARAFDAVRDVHPMLQRRFVTDSLDTGSVWHDFAATKVIPLQTIDPSLGWEGLQASTESVARVPISPETGPLFRLAGANVEGNRARLVLTLHHLCVDDVGFDIVVRDLSSAYDRLSNGQPADLFRSEATFLDFVDWERAFVATPEAQSALAELAVSLEAGETDSLQRTIPPELQEHEDGVWIERVPDDLALKAAAFAKSINGTAYQVFAAAFMLLLRRLGSGDDIRCLTASGLRRLASQRRCVGDYVNTIPLRLAAQSEDTFRDFCLKVRRQIIFAMERSAVPYDLVSRTGSIQAAGGNGGIEAMFLENLPPLPFSPGDAACRVWRAATGSSKVELTVSLMRAGAGATTLRIEYMRSFADAALAQQLANSLLTLLRSGLEAPGNPICSFDMVDDGLRADMLSRSCGQALRRSELPVQDTIVSACRDHPELTALIALDADGHRQDLVNYGELEAWSGRVAEALRSVDFAPGTPVALMAHRGCALPVAVLGILRAGGSYLPLDPDHPSDRLTHILQEAAPAVVLVTREFASASVLENQFKLVIEDFRSGDAAISADRAVRPETAAYVLYTSGSTGRPKGVVNTHAGLRNRLDWMQEAFALATEDRVLQKTPISFDVSVWELLWPLMFGAAMVLPAPNIHREGHALATIIEQERITVLHFVPSLLRLFLQAADPAKCRSVKHLVCSGEALGTDLVEQWRLHFQGDIHNLYGPTEAAIDVSSWTGVPPIGEPIVPIGTPISNTDLFVLDCDRQLLPPGVVGVLHIGGVNLASGYLARPELTAAAFVWTEGLGERPIRLYDTGDLAFWRRDGSLQFVGRGDTQVKLGGVRIELVEIENVLREHPAIADVAITLQRNPADEPFLVAHIVRKDENVAIQTIEASLRKKVPAAMVPSAFLTHGSLPTTLSGKTDRNRLAASFSNPSPTNPSTADRDYWSALERQIAAAWRQVLQRDDFERDVSFFSLGGNSLRSLRVAAILRGEGIAATVAVILAAPTIESLAVELSRTALPYPADPATSHDTCPSTFPAPRLIELFWHLSQTSQNYSCYATTVRLAADLNPELLLEAIRAAVARHAMLRTTLLPPDSTPRPMLQVNPQGEPILDLLDWSHVRSLNQRQMIDAWCRAESSSWDWSRTVACRFVVHRWPGGEFQLTLVEPWLDGWSVQTVIAEILHDYAALLAGKSATERAPLLLTYANHATRELEAAEDPLTREFWSRALRDLKQSPVAHGVVCGPQLRVAVDLGDLGRQCRTTALQLGVPVKSIFLAAHMKVVSTLAGSGSATTGVMFNTRPEEIGAEDVVGLYLNALPISIEVAGTSWSQLARACLDAEVAVTPWRYFPSDELHQMADEPLFDSLFNYTDFSQLRETDWPKTVSILERVGYDQTYTALCAQFGTDAIEAETSLDLEIDATLGERVGIEAIARLYRISLEASCMQTSQSTDNLDVLGSALSVVRGDDRRSIVPGGVSLYGLFEAQCMRNPGAVALLDRDFRATFAEFRAAVEALSGCFRANFLESGDRVGLHLGRGWETVAAILACARCGLVFVPLPHDGPSERLEFIARDADLRILLTRNMPTDALVPLTISISDALSFPRDVEPVPDRLDNDPAVHILYTSGSTGRPKGVLTKQSTILNRLLWMWQAWPFSNTEMMAHKTSLTFVDSIWEIFGALLQGTPTQIIPEEVIVDREAFLNALRPCTRLSMVPSLLASLMADEKQFTEALKNIRVLISSGESLRPQIASDLRRLLPRAQILNLYGATETGGDAAAQQVRDLNAERNSVGNPLPGCWVTPIDSSQRPCLPGVNGELLVAGACLADGYVGWAATAREESDRWTLDPFGRRAWRTGDLGRICLDGSIIVDGRVDRQIKVRGVRVEPGEVENALLGQPGVRQAVVRLDSDGELTAIVEGFEVLEIRDLRSRISARLIPAMVPSRFILVDHIPTLPSGKLDVSALLEGSNLRSEPELPSTAMEQLVADAMEQVFEGTSVGRESSFFELGGHSLKAGALSARLRQSLGRPVPVRLVFEFPQVAELAAELERLAGPMTQNP
jgi:amino acid adenylation domain-containing protein